MPATSSSKHDIRLAKRSIDAARPLRVAVVGAGISGILAGIELPRAVEGLELVIYDKNEELGGTWFENKYPGCACDIPAHCYQLSFESNPAWSTFYASAPEILEYWKKVANKYGVRKYMKLSHKVQEARWSEEEGKWHLKVEDLLNNRVISDAVDVLYQCVGGLNSWKWPDIPGLHDFKGTLLHSAAWDESFDCTNKTVAVIGAGSSAIQITPALQPHVQHLDQYVRGATWIANQFVDGDVVSRMGPAGGNFAFSAAEIADWRANPASYLAYRRALEATLQSAHGVTFKGSAEQQAARTHFTDLMMARMAGRDGLAEKLLPDFPPVCKRLTPGPGFLEALTQENVETIKTPISHVDATGIVDTAGVHRPADAIVCATGFDTSYTGRFPCYGQRGTDLRAHWAAYPRSYLSLATDGFPNCFFALGPNSALGAGNLLLLIERAVGYVAQACAKLQREHVRSMQPRRAAVDGFVGYCATYFAGTVFSEECSSWYKAGQKTGPVVALWPGSSLHAAQALRRPRWEDWAYESLAGPRRGGQPEADHGEYSVGWLGDGWSVRDRAPDADRAFYLTAEGGMLDEPVGKPMIARESRDGDDAPATAVQAVRTYRI